MSAIGTEWMNKGKNAENTFHYSKQQLLDLYQDTHLIPEHMIELPVVVKDILKPWALLAANVQEEELAKIPVVQKKEPGFKYASGRGRGASRGGKGFHREGHGTWEQKDWGKRRTDRSSDSVDQLSPEDLRRPKEELMWHYKDPSAQIQGPFDDANMTKWYDDGYFPDDLLVKRVFQAEFVELRDLPKDSNGNPFSTPDPKPPGFGGVAPKKSTAPPKQGEKDAVDDGEAMEHIMQDIMKSYGKNPQDTSAAPQPVRVTPQPTPTPVVVQPQIPVVVPQQPTVVPTPSTTATTTVPSPLAPSTATPGAAPFRQGPNPQFVYPQMLGRPMVPPSVPLQRKEGVFVMDEYGIPRDINGNVAPAPAPAPVRAWTGQANPMMYHPQMPSYPSPNPWMMMQMMNQQQQPQPQPPVPFQQQPQVLQPQPIPQPQPSPTVVAPVQPEPVKQPQVPATAAPVEPSTPESDGFQTQSKDRKKKEKKAPQSPKSSTQKPETEEQKPAKTTAAAPKPKETLKPPQPPKQEGHFKDIQQQQEKQEQQSKKERDIQQQQQQAAVKQAKASWGKVDKPAKSLTEIIAEQSQEIPSTPKKVVEAPKPTAASGKMAWNVKKVAEPAPVANKEEFPSLKK